MGWRQYLLELEMNLSMSVIYEPSKGATARCTERKNQHNESRRGKAAGEGEGKVMKKGSIVSGRRASEAIYFSLLLSPISFFSSFLFHFYVIYY